MNPIGRPTDDALWAGVAQTLRYVVLPSVADEFARTTVVQLIGLAQYARFRGADPSAGRVEAIAVTLDELADRPVVEEHWSFDGPRDPKTVLAAASAVLVACVGLPDDDPDATAIRSTLRPMLLADLDADLIGNSGLLTAFRGRLADA